MKKKPAKKQRTKKGGAGRPTDRKSAEKRGKVFALLYEKYLASVHRLSAGAPVSSTIVRSADLKREIATNNRSKRTILDDVASFSTLIRQGSHGSLFVPSDIYYHKRLFVRRHLKEAVAKKVVGLVEGGTSIACSAGTTVALCARRIIEAGIYVQILTTNVGIADVGMSTAEIELTGGAYDPVYHSCSGDRAIQAFNEVKSRWALMGVSGIDEYGGLYVKHEREPELRAAMIKSTTERVVIVADARKLAQRDPRQFATINGLLADHPVMLITNVPDKRDLGDLANRAEQVLNGLRGLESESNGQFQIVLAD